MAQVSVIVPTHNRSQVLAGALKSVLEQSFKDMEIIVVDDCSDDDTAAMVESLQKEAAVRYFRHDQRRGAAASCNTGIIQSTGEYVAFLDDDHEWYTEKLARQMQCLLASPPEVGGVYTGRFMIDRTTGKIRDQVVPTTRGNVHDALLAGNCIGSVSAMLMRRSCVEEAGGFEEGLPSFYDYDLWLRAARKYQFECIREPLLKQYVPGDKLVTDTVAFTRGLELMLEKYGQSPAFRRNCGVYYLRLGMQFCEARQFNAGRKALLRAARLQPMAPEPYLYLLLAVLGRDSFRITRATKARLLPRLQRRAVRSFAEKNV